MTIDWFASVHLVRVLVRPAGPVLPAVVVAPVGAAATHAISPETEQLLQDQDQLLDQRGRYLNQLSYPVSSISFSDIFQVRK